MNPMSESEEQDQSLLLTGLEGGRAILRREGAVNCAPRFRMGEEPLWRIIKKKEPLWSAVNPKLSNLEA